ncbi:MAG TPA: proton-conducting transporter membrane subunit [Bacteroidales bacterium]|nr:proton-conducting transporter membrane subunit [Bacteroidales bacterium]
MMDSEGWELIEFLFNSTVITLFAGILTIPFVSVRFRKIIAVITVSVLAVLSSFVAISCFQGSEIVYVINGGIFFGDIPFRVDHLSAWFILIINFTAVTGVIYGSGYLKSEGQLSHLISSHWILYIIFHFSMLLVTVVQHSVVFIVAWEIMSISSFLLVLLDYTDPKVMKAGVNYLVQMHISVVVLTVAFIWVYFKTGTFDFKGIDVFFLTNKNIWLFLLFFSGFGMKAGFIGFHTWLPLAHPAAPSHISGVMSGVIVKMGIYGILRIIFYLKSDFIVLGEIVLILSLLTALFGIMNSAVHRDFKRMLAYCTIENIGIIGIGLGVGLIGIGQNNNVNIFLGFGGALLHVLNHSLFKSLLFFSSGSVYRQTHTRNMDMLGGILKFMPKTGILFLTGAIAIAGIPPLNGFVSKFLIYCGVLSGIDESLPRIVLMILTFAGMSLISGISLLAFSKTFSAVFLGTPRKESDHKINEVSAVMLVPQYFIVILILLIGFFPGFFLKKAGSILEYGLALNMNEQGLQNYFDILKNISYASFILIGVVTAVSVSRYLLTRKSDHKALQTWGCGYLAPNPKIQYTGKSFSKSFGKLMNFLMIEKKGYKEIRINETFPSERTYSSYYLDFFVTRIIDPLLKILNGFIDRFQFIQNGKIQAYVLYGIIFIMAIFIGTILNFLK